MGGSVVCIRDHDIRKAPQDLSRGAFYYTVNSNEKRTLIAEYAKRKCNKRR